MEGWICPRCRSCYSPFVSQCLRCPLSIVTAPSLPVSVVPLTVGPIGCTCGTSVAGWSCPIHGSNTCQTGSRFAVTTYGSQEPS